MGQRRDANLAFHSISDRIKQNFSKWLLIYQRFSIEAHKQMIQTSRKSSYGSSHK